MTETRKKLNLDRALRDWPEDEKSSAEWDEGARSIDERIARGDLGASVATVSEGNLFAEPLGQIAGEGHNSAAPPSAESKPKDKPMTMPVDRERDRRSLQDLAKMASMTPAPASVKMPLSNPSGVERPGEAKKDDSGIIDLAAASQADPHASVRAQSTPLAKAGLFDEEPASSQVPQQLLQQPAPSIPPFGPASVPPPSVAPASAVPSALTPAPSAAAPSLSAPLSIAPQSAARPAEQKKKGSGAVIALVLGGVVALSAAAAGGFLFLKHRAETAAHGALAMNDPAPGEAPDTKPATPAPTQAAASEPAPSPEGTVDSNALPTAAPNNPKVAAAPKSGPAAGGRMAAAPAAAEKPAKAEGPKISEKDLPSAPSAPEGDLSKAMGKAVGSDGKPLEATPAAGNTGPQFAAGTVPQKPSQGAVTGAIGAVLPGARACLGPDDPISRASIVFTSSGTVQSVSVSGGAAGKPAEGCIRGALMKAKLAPFAEPTYTANITVRHN